MATGLCIDEKVKDSFIKTAPQVIFIGDCNKVGSLHNTAASGYYASLML